MEKHPCKLCCRRFSNGRALGGHMRSHVVSGTTAVNNKQNPPSSLHQNPNFVTSSSSSGPEEAEHETNVVAEEDEADLKLAGVNGNGGFYGLRENPRKSLKFSDPEFSALDYTSFFTATATTNNNYNNSASVVVQDRESETESSSLPAPPPSSRRRSNRSQRHSFVPSAQATVEVEPVSSVSDTTPDEDVARCLMMLSRDIWAKETKIAKHEHQEVVQKQSGGEENYLSSSSSAEERRILKKRSGGGRIRFQCGTCKKVFRSYQALGGHRASHKKLKSCGGGGGDYKQIRDEAEETNAAAASDPKIHECPFCFRVFSSGQALGGHKRSHLASLGSSGHPPPSRIKIGESTIDLNLPAPLEEDEEDVEFSAVSDAS